MSNFGVMVARIEREIHRNDLTVEVKEAINTAISEREAERYFFNEGRADLTLVAGVEFYPIPADVIELDTVKVWVNNNAQTLVHKTHEYVENVASSYTNTGQPCAYSTYANQIRVYPTPNLPYVLNLTYLKRSPKLVADADTNLWLTEAEKLIRCMAKFELYSHNIQDAEKAMEMRSIADEAEKNLVSRSRGVLTTGRFTSTAF